ncbi:MAG: serine/threonine-protein kinase [Dehalococcoidia bacterium]
MVLAPGTTIGKYEVERQIGAGGVATVYKVRHRTFEQSYALKLIASGLADSSEFKERFHQEAKAAARLDHPSVLKIHYEDEFDGSPYIVYDYLPGGTLQDQLHELITPEKAVALLRPVAAALDYAHSEGVVHRDIKPGNILLKADGTPVVADFGLAKFLGPESQHLTQTGMTVGTPLYMAPEQATGRPVSPATDQYALAIIAYQLLVGKPPFDEKNPALLLHAHVRDSVPPASKQKPDLPPAVDAVLARGLAKEPAKRFPTASAFIEALTASLKTGTDRERSEAEVFAADMTIVEPRGRKLSLAPDSADAKSEVGDLTVVSSPPDSAPASPAGSMSGTLAAIPRDSFLEENRLPSQRTNGSRSRLTLIFAALGVIALLLLVLIVLVLSHA